MRHGRQICEGCDYHEGTYCLSQAHWKITLLPWHCQRQRGKPKYTITVFVLYLCTTCHAMAELDWAAKAIPRKTQWSPEGFEAQEGHTALLARHAAAFADACNSGRLTGQQQILTFPSFGT